MPVLPHHEIIGAPDAPPLILASALGAAGRMWDPQRAALAERFRVIVYDHRGHGRSPVPPGPYTLDDLGGDVLALLDHLGLSSVRFAGLSLGGMVGMWLASHAPERVERLALLCTSARLGTPEVWRERAEAVRRGGTAAVADAVLERWFTPDLRRRSPETVAAVRETFLSTPAEGYAACCAAIETMDLTGDLASITAPTLVLAAKDDPSTPVEPHAKTIADGIAGARLVIVPDAAHLVNVERPDVVTRHLLDHFLGES
ncbi:3-oxoadipate enol-lactonase [Thermostaphylospora chromogena]|uniref:3-oxoadipate enol-lactonase n=1 Tax=Thermostaphylospora chromogena TaxID=35622 RepID=A0A1H1A8Z3_9ACTN|nr:3-oxoadipate enol-lactonase [Thermostaphylospora chromogena]SDQ36198.1 3-oxoadipate enol-lactonase [Thermostaphylospora chromogena]